MRCLMCGQLLRSEGSLNEILFREDLLCETCRNTWKRIDRRFTLDNVKGYALYEYHGGFSSALLQYKECFDEALAPIFLYEERNRLKWKYRGYTILLMPSTKSAVERRGFVHLKGMFEGLGLEMMDCFEKTEEVDQTMKDRKERERMAGQIRLKAKTVLPKKILLVDDVMTTGSTLRGALSQIDRSEHKIRILCCAIAEEDRKKETVSSNHKILHGLGQKRGFGG